MATPMELLYNGSFLKAIDLLYSTHMDAWWIIIMVVMTLVVLFIVTKSEAVVSLCGIFISAFLLVYKPDGIPILAHTVLYMIIVLSLAVFLYTIFGRKE